MKTLRQVLAAEGLVAARVLSEKKLRDIAYDAAYQKHRRSGDPDPRSVPRALKSKVQSGMAGEITFDVHYKAPLGAPYKYIVTVDDSGRVMGTARDWK